MSETNWHLAGGRADHGPYRPVTTLIEQQCARTPDRPAVTFRGATETTLTYAEFDALANGLATELAEAGVRAGDVVPVVLGNSLELPLCMVALTKLGAAFSLCDPAWPEERLRAVLVRPGPPLVLTATAAVVEHGAHVVAADRIRPRGRGPDVPAPGADTVAYGVFTSGSTGAPKCALNVHRGLTNRLRFMTRWFAATGDEVVLQNSRHTFDSAIWQLLWPLTTGGRTIVPEQGEFLDLERTVEIIHRYRVTVTDFVPAILGMLVALLEAEPAAVAKVASLRHVVVGGEEIIPHAVHRLRALVPGLEITNGYGPSETAIGMVFHRIAGDEGDSIPLGRPIDNCYAVVADDRLTPLPPGRTGEILVGGACVGAGYLDDPARTAQAFVPNPHARIPGPRLYRTGDLGWFDEAGVLRFAGRRDRQVKVDGVRIEPAEIETAAEGCAGVIQAKALTVRRGGRNRLVVAAAAEDGTAPAALRAHLVSVLPRIHLPQHCFVLESLPLSDNGKVDLEALRRIVTEKLAAGGRPGVRDGDPPAERVADIVRGILGLPDFGVDDDFLAHGGDSLSALAATIAVRDALGVPVVVSDLYAHRSPGALAAAVLHRPAPDGDAVAKEESALMEHDALLPADLARAAARAAGSVAVLPPRTVLVTGASGFVGSRVVHRLLGTTPARVVCLVRAHDDVQAGKRMVAALRAQGLWAEALGPRLDARAGDLAQPRFGWHARRWERYAVECDAVLHAGALVNFLLGYGDHRAANVAGTAHVLRFALAGRPKPLHHVSTLGVLDRHALHTGTRLGEGTDARRVTVPGSGYSRSKLVAEQLLLRARELGAPVTLYRLGEIMPAVDNGLPNPRALTHLLLSAFHELGLRPAVPMRTDYTPVDETAARLVAGLAEGATGADYHVFRAGSVDLAAVGSSPAGPAADGGPRPLPPRAFTAALAAAAAADERSAAALLHAVLTSLPAGRADGTPDFARLLTDNPRLFTRARCAGLEERHGLRDGPLDEAFAAYRATLAG
ncbi:amino acid adenylation domain-containing protein [Streptomyces sp. WMMC500]|uniref:non-ribosomal peptide synthetase n=1 Tax=Streptomyces sp. WMMC500 TaxID=3015154 RepID=UPI00248B5632|nr:amino acid adenylation domain-containing protein [Streptomyces sp. WMMC500]WBB63409.1 amino acid adenylation domain-containing protein [Streptomyces sp. WMMC500]